MTYAGDENLGNEITSGPYAEGEGEDETQSFEEWMEEVNRIVMAAVGMSIHDLPDMKFRDAYDDEDSPEGFCDDNLGIEDGMLVDDQLFAEATDM